MKLKEKSTFYLRRMLSPAFIKKFKLTVRKVQQAILMLLKLITPRTTIIQSNDSEQHEEQRFIFLLFFLQKNVILHIVFGILT